MNCLRSVPAFAGCFLELNDVYWVLRSTNMFFKVSRYFYDESEFIVASLSPLRGQYQARNQDFMWGGANEAKVDQTTEGLPKCIFYCLIRLFRKEAIHEKL